VSVTVSKLRLRRSAKGARFASESRLLIDPQSGRPLRQITSHPSIHHHPFFFVPAYDRAGQKLIFISHRAGAPQIFFEDRTSGELVQATDRPDIAEWSVHPSSDGRFVYFTAATGAWRVDLEDFCETQLADFGAVEMREKGMVGAAMGTTALSADGRWWAIPVKAGKISRFVVIDTQAGTSRVILERDTIGHPQFCPDDSNLILYAGPLIDRVWVVNRDGSGNRRAYEREYRMQWVTHEVWLPGRRAIAFVDWPRGIRFIDLESATTEWVTRFPAWHAAPDAAAERLVCDTNFPDRGLHIVSANGEAEFLCASDSSSEGAHWGGPFPYNDGPVAVEARQHTHPHPRFSSDGARVVFTSDRTGHAQIYEIEIGERPQ
jgi:oligogalacturonide lyase